MMGVFEQCFAVVVGEEGGYGNDYTDPGNWTGGACGVGTLRGTKYGISAKAFPSLDIANLTLADARAIYRRDYWQRIRGDDLPPPVALVVFDAAVNSGVEQAGRWLEAASGAPVDQGVIGPETLAAVQAASGRGAELIVDMLMSRLVFLASLPEWRDFRDGWTRRILGLPFKAMQLQGGA